MKSILKSKKKLLLVVMLMMITLTGCSVPRDRSGKTYVKSIITLKEETVEKKIVSTDYNEEVKKEYKDLKDTDLITLKPTSFGDMMDEGWFEGLIVFPIAQLINLAAGFTDGGIGIIAATLLIQLLIFLFSIKSQVASQRMQTLQPELNRIQAKYAGKNDERSKLMMAQETQALYSKYKINPFGTIVITFIQFPVILGMYQATMRAYSVVTGKFAGISLVNTPIQGFNAGHYAAMVIFVLMVLFQLISFKLPQWLQEHRKKKNHVKEKKYAEPKNAPKGMMGSMNMMMYMSTGMIAILAINWPLGMSFYWLVNSIARVIQNIIIHKFFIKD